MTRSRTPSDDPPPPLTKEQASAILDRATERDADGRPVISDAEALRALAALVADQEPDPPPATLEEENAELRRQLRFERKGREGARLADTLKANEIVRLAEEARLLRERMVRHKRHPETIEKIETALRLQAEGVTLAEIAEQLDMEHAALKKMLQRHRGKPR
jgi:hypothetical protein